MAGGFNFSIDFDSSAFKRGSDEAAESLEKLSTSLEDVERSDVSEAERGVSDVGTAADTAGERVDELGRRFSETFEKAREDSRTTGESMGESLEGPLTATQDMMNEVKQSLGESMGELAGSFAENGFNMEDSIDGVVEVAAEAAQALPGPFGLAGGALVTIAAGVYGEWQKRMEQIEERAGEMYQDMLESGADFVSDQFFQKQLQQFFDPMGESYDANMKKISVAEDLGVPVDVAARALVGYGEEADQVLSLARERMEEYRGTTSLLDDDFGALASGAVQDVGDVITSIEDSKTSTDTARRAVNHYRDSIEEIPGKKNTDVDVDDHGSIRNTQREIDNVRGSSASVTVYADTTPAQRALASLISQASATVGSLLVGRPGSWNG